MCGCVCVRGVCESVQGMWVWMWVCECVFVCEYVGLRGCRVSVWVGVGVGVCVCVGCESLCVGVGVRGGV